MNNNQIRLCLNCGIIGETHVHSHWKSNIIEPYGSSDICEICGRETVIDIDSEIAHYIYRLNKMGYKTAYSCAGHAISNYSEAYILFSNDCFDKLKSILTEEKLGYDITDEKSDVVLYKIKRTACFTPCCAFFCALLCARSKKDNFVIVLCACLY